MTIALGQGTDPPPLQDPAQELAQRVADNFFQHGDFPHYNTFLPQLVDLITTELRAGGWRCGYHGRRGVKRRLSRQPR